jgi:hypothetical protein
VSRLKLIDHRLADCRLALHSGTIIGLDKVWDTIDELLDERLAITGPPAVPIELPPPLPVVAPKPAAVGRCHVCENGVPLRYIPPAVDGAVAVWLLDCPMCDRSKCQVCSAYVQDRRTKKCPKGHELKFT